MLWRWLDKRCDVTNYIWTVVLLALADDVFFRQITDVNTLNDCCGCALASGFTEWKTREEHRLEGHRDMLLKSHRCDDVTATDRDRQRHGDVSIWLTMTSVIGRTPVHGDCDALGVSKQSYGTYQFFSLQMAVNITGGLLFLLDWRRIFSKIWNCFLAWF